jgi:excisionase family DNA binding protein
MVNHQDKLVSLAELAEQVRLPKSWLRAQADTGTIPYLKVGRRYRFNLPAVSKVLGNLAGGKEQAVTPVAERAAQGGGQ